MESGKVKTEVGVRIGSDQGELKGVGPNKEHHVAHL